MKTNKLDSFERFVNDSLSGEEVAYNPSDWNNLSSRLNNSLTKPFYKTGWFLGGAASIIIGASLFAYQSSNKGAVSEGLTVVAEQNNVAQKQTDVERPIINNNNVIILETKEELTKEDKNISSETISKEEIVEEVTTNHQIPKEPSIVSSITTQDNEKENQSEDKEDVKVVTPTANYKTIGKVSGCKGLIVSFKAEEQKNVNYLWNFGDGTYSNLLAPQHTYNKEGEYIVELIVQSTIVKGVLTKSNKEELITIHKDPQLEIIAEEYLDKGCSMVSYSYVGDNISKVFWNLGNGVSSNKKTVKTAYKKRGNYNIAIEAISNEGCKAIFSKNQFIEKDYNLLAPSAFTPDGDGLNDEFIPEALKLMNNQFTMVIQSRTEGIVFETKSLDRPWDGKNQKTGLECSEKNYVWIVNVINDKGEKEQYTGAVLIQR